MFSILLGGTLGRIKLKRGQFYRKPSRPCFRGALRSSAPESQDCSCLYRLWDDSQHWWERALSSVLGIGVMKISLVFRVTGLFRRPDEPVTEEMPKNTPSVDGQVRETEAVAQRWCVGAGPHPSWPHPRGLGC